MSKQNLPYDEVVDTFADSVEVAELIRERLKDGAGFDDLYALFQAYPKLLEIYNDRNTFWAQFTDLTDEETALVYHELGERFGMQISTVEGYVLGAFDIAAETYALVNYNISAFHSLKFKATRLFAPNAAA